MDERSSELPFVAFFDGTCPVPYDANSLVTDALGGTEATIVRVAEALGACVYQHNRSVDSGRYRAMERFDGAERIVVIRDPRAAIEVASRFGDARVFLWLHDLIDPGKDRTRRLQDCAAALASSGVRIIAVSRFHAAQIRRAFEELPATRPAPEITIVYNPLPDHLCDRPAAVKDIDKLVYFSSPAKGLDFALYLFPELKRRWPRLTFFVGSPGYCGQLTSAPRGVVLLGHLPHADVIRHAAEALCGFYPNFEFPETFGLVLAETNVVGTPVLAIDAGAAAEVLADDNRPIALGEVSTIGFRAARKLGFGFGVAARITALLGGFDAVFSSIERFRRTGGKRPAATRAAFEMKHVAEAWRDVLRAGPV